MQQPSLWRRRWLMTAGVAAMLSSHVVALAQGFPQRPVRLIVPYAPGGGPDQTTRLLAELVAPILGTPVVVENKVGAGGMIGADFVARTAPDGYTLLLGSSAHVTQKLLQPSLSFDPLTDFTHIIRQTFGPMVLVVRADSPYTDTASLMAAIQQAPGKFNYASGGIGGAAHLAGAVFLATAELEAEHIPYRGSVDIVPAVLVGDVEFAFAPLSTAAAQLASGKVRALASTAEARFSQLPDVPTLNEVFGRDDLLLDAWIGIWAPAGLPEPITLQLEQALRQAFADPRLIQHAEETGSVISPTASPAEFTAFIEDETQRFQTYLQQYGIALP